MDRQPSTRPPIPWLCRQLPAPLLLVLFTILHITSLAGNDPLFKTRDTLFFADASDYVVATRQPALAFGEADFMLRDGYASEADMQRVGALFNRAVLLKKARKHPLFFPVNHLVYTAWKKLTRPLKPDWTIADERRALLFPSALFGAAAVAGLFLFFRRHGRDSLLALLFALLFGFALGKWIYSSLPETYSLQILICVGLTVMIFELRRLEWGQALLLALATACAILAGVSNILLVFPLFLLFVLNKKIGPGLAYAALTALTVIGAYFLLSLLVSPELSLSKSFQLAGAQVVSHSTVEAGLFFKRLIPVAGNHFFFSIGAIHVGQSGFTRPGALLRYVQSPLPALFLVSYIVFLILLVRQLINTGFPAPRDRCLALVSWLTAHLLFYSVFNSAQPFLYTSTFLVPLVTLCFFIFCRKQTAGEEKAAWHVIRRGALILLVLATFLDNQAYLLRFLQ